MDFATQVIKLAASVVALVTAVVRSPLWARLTRRNKKDR